MGHLVVSASELEREDRKQVLSLEQDIALQAITQIDGWGQRCLLDNIVNFGRRDQSDVLGNRQACSISRQSVGQITWKQLCTISTDIGESIGE